MKFLKIELHALSLGLIVESEFTTWVNVFALVATRSDYTPMLTTVYGQPAKANALRHEKIAEVGTDCQCSYKISSLSVTNSAMSVASNQIKIKFPTMDDTHFGFIFLSELYDSSVVRFRSYSSLARIQLQDLRKDLQRTHRNLNSRNCS